MEFETARRVLSDSSQPLNPALAMGLVVDIAKTTDIGYSSSLTHGTPRLVSCQDRMSRWWAP